MNERISGISMNRKKVRDINYPLRHFESMIEVAVITLLYYLMWKFFYRPESIQNFHGRGKIVFMLVYALIVLFMFSFNRKARGVCLPLKASALKQCVLLFLLQIYTPD